MNLIHTLLAFLLALGPLIIFHELGHYVVARLCGVKVLRFSIGMGRIVWSRRFGPDQTEWAISALPIGGYVKMLDARDPATAPTNDADLPREFTRQNVWKRIAIVAAGPVANFILAIFLMAALFMHGKEEPGTRLRPMAPASAVYQAGVRGGDVVTAVNGRPVQSWTELRWELVRAAVDKHAAELALRGPVADSAPYRAVLPADRMAALDVDGDVLGVLGMQMWRPRPTIEKVLPDGPAARAGLRQGDLVTTIDGKPVVDGIAFIEAVRGAAGKTLQVGVLRGADQVVLPVTPDRDPQSGKGIVKAMIAQAPELVTVQAGPLEAVAKGAKRTWETSALTVKMIAKMIVGEVSLKNVTGPITIADVAGQTARSGVEPFLEFIAFISISLGVMNLLPIPVLDGGHLLYYSLEVLTGRPLPARIGEIAQRAGVGLLFMLMALAVFNDLVRLL
ncbi:RIP metalloprotease RseP [Massilia sp. TW-1]|uniref:Zinc metalloprotease n=1 Tax=Telluria antibiotica TaxID=2717319 RepID=A0ABX0P6M1_9BURK|nr:RIP metalloprotease RseP [Telluria antibiotica]NIA52586.1 RIP metalloprotease RseP [Telluria antibiotica]